MNIYWNGRLQTDDSRPSGPSLVGIVGPVKPAFTVFGSTVQLSLRTGLKKPTKCSGKRKPNYADKVIIFVLQMERVLEKWRQA